MMSQSLVVGIVRVPDVGGDTVSVGRDTVGVLAEGGKGGLTVGGDGVLVGVGAVVVVVVAGVVDPSAPPLITFTVIIQTATPAMMPAMMPPTVAWSVTFQAQARNRTSVPVVGAAFDVGVLLPGGGEAVSFGRGSWGGGVREFAVGRSSGDGAGVSVLSLGMPADGGMCVILAAGPGGGV
jgi:hypothetical protein